MLKNSIKTTNSPVLAKICVYVKIPASYSNKKRISLIGTYATVKPDLDNCQKIIFDAISKDAWNKSAYLLDNDNQICKINASKRYAEIPFVRLAIYKID